MHQALFEREMHKAKAFGRTGDLQGQEYWTGYQLGLRRRFHGESFGTVEEHNLRLTATGDESRDERSRGYREGFYGPCDWAEQASAVRTLRAWRGWSVADLAERLGRSQRTVEGWEQGRAIPPAALKTLLKLHVD